MPRAIFRCDASPQIGGGHVMRCLTLADVLSETGWRCGFLTVPTSLDTVPVLASKSHDLILLDTADEDEPADLGCAPESCALFVVDHYERGKAYETQWRDRADRILVIDDLADREHDCDALLDQCCGRRAEAYDGLLPETAARLIGPNYALLRPAFRAERAAALCRRESAERVRRVLVSLGASAPRDLLTAVLEAIAACDPNLAVDLVTGASTALRQGFDELAGEMAPKVTVHGFDADLPALMRDADVAIGAGGVTALERCCLGLPSLLIVMADNQVEQARALSEGGLGIRVGDAREITRDDIVQSLGGLVGNPATLRSMAHACMQNVDGGGARRVAEAIERIVRQEDLACG